MKLNMVTEQQMELLKQKGLERINELFGTNYKDYSFAITYGSECAIKESSSFSKRPLIIYSTPNRKDKIFDEVSKIIETAWRLEKAEVEFEQVLRETGVIK